MNAELELDDLRRSWQALERKLEAQHALNLELATETRVDKAKARLRPVLIGQVLQAAIGWVLDFWPRTGSGGWDPRGYSAALAFSLLLQLFIAARLIGGRR